MENTQKSQSEEFLDVIRPIQDTLTPQERKRHYENAVAQSGIKTVVLPKKEG